MYLDETDIKILNERVERINANREEKDISSNWDILSEIAYGILYLELRKSRYEYERSQAVGAAQDPR